MNQTVQTHHFPVLPEDLILGGDFRILALFAAQGGTLRRRNGDKWAGYTRLVHHALTVGTVIEGVNNNDTILCASMQE